MSKETNHRIIWLDWAKFIGISLVVWGHFSPLGRHDIFLFHMPFFFMISGLLFKQKGFRQEVKRSVHCLLIPYLLYNLLYMTPLPFGGARDLKTIVNVVLGNQEQLCYVMVPLWFLVALIVIRIVCSSTKLNLAYIGIGGCIVSVILYGLFHIDQTNDYFQLKTACFCVPFFVIGRYLRPLLEYVKTKWWVAVFVFVAFLFGIILGRWNTPDEMPNVLWCRYGDSIFVYYVSSIMLSISLLVLIAYLFKNIHFSITETLSKGTLLILCLHLPLCWQIPQFTENTILMPIANYLIIMIISYFLIRLSEKYLPFMIGKWKK